MARCPYCTGEVDDRALVCATCGRDIAVPEALVREHDELIRKRDRLRTELAEARARLTARGRRLAPRTGAAE
ncbi:MAG: hypothetical protein P4M07_11405 [Xanthobacteraceae bacterium]|nr:hypothetical protein [Xanthobacteraceae bacterium]